ncbi:MAG: hypothetical protein WA821_01660 [Anaerolineales bacterium]
MDREEELHFDTNDLKGNRIICTEARWQDHIVGSAKNYMQRHREFDGNEDVILDALRKPITGIRYRSHKKGFERSMIYYGKGITDRYSRIVIRFDDETCNGTGEFVTAISVPGMHDGEEPEL